VGDQIGSGGFGNVYLAKSGEVNAVAKLVPKVQGTARELLFVNLANVRNVVPIIDSGEHENYWVLIMPRAEGSLREHLNESGGSLSLSDTIEVLKYICDALVDLDGRVVHRDLKPENILRLNGRWCLADFGISRYAEATTAPDTQKFAFSPPYAAPERWRSERATTAADVYAVGIIAYELLVGSRPFPGPTIEHYREQHLHSEPPDSADLPWSFSALIDECLFKAPEARPTPTNLRARLERIANSTSPLPGIARLEAANHAEIRRRSNIRRQESEIRTKAERRAALANAAERSFKQINTLLRDTIRSAAPSATELVFDGGGWSFELNEVKLILSKTHRIDQLEWGGRWEEPAFDVIACSSLVLILPGAYPERWYQGRSHSIWYGDIQAEGSYCWFETAFRLLPSTGVSVISPFHIDPGDKPANGDRPNVEIVWPFTPLILDRQDEFVDRWAGWFADAADGQLDCPEMPERDPHGSWRG
jgi:serine/threonine-protein kinase